MATTKNKRKYVWSGGERRIPNMYDSFSSLTKSCVLSRLRCVLPFIKRKSIIVDLGCGVGWNTKYISMYCDKIYGIDISKEAIEYAKEKNGASNIEWKVQDMYDLTNFESNSCDLIVSIAAIEHVTKDQMIKMLAECSRVLKPGSYFVGTTTKFHAVGKVEATRWHKYEPGFKDFKNLCSPYFKIINIKNIDIETPDLVRKITEGVFILKNAK